MTFTHKISAEVVLDSISPDGVRLTTISTTYNRNIIQEVMMHREQSRSSGSSRAIPFELMLERAIEHPAPFVEIRAEKKGMQGGDLLEGEDLEDVLSVLASIHQHTTDVLQQYLLRHPDKSTRAHKSILNRPLEWFSWQTTVLSATQWDNYFRQRAHADAQPEFRELAYLVRDALRASEPQQIDWGEWHLPFLQPGEREKLGLLDAIRVSVARCARTSYLNHDGVLSHESDFRLYDQTLSTKGHWAPLEHAAVCLRPGEVEHFGNFRPPWHQWRHFVEYLRELPIPTIPEAR